MHRARSFALVVAVAVVVSTWASVTSAKALPVRQDDPPIDLTALAIYPPDTGDDDYVVVDGKSCLTAAACADPIFFGAATEVMAQGAAKGASGLPLPRFVSLKSKRVNMRIEKFSKMGFWDELG